MRVSILVHNLNRADDLRRCLRSICKQNHRPLEIVLLDAGSTDGSLDVIDEYKGAFRECGIEQRFVACSLMGVAASRDLAASYATGDLLTFLDNDACLELPETIARVVEKFSADPRLAAVAFRILDRQEASIDQSTWVYRRSPKKWASVPFLTFTFAGAGCCIRADIFASLGGFWKALRYSREEEELGLGIIHAGFWILYSPDVVVRHFQSPKGRYTIAERRAIELRNGILVLWRRLPMPVAVLAIVARVSAMCVKLAVRREGRPLWLLSSVRGAFSEWRNLHLDRSIISWPSVLRYAALHCSPSRERK